MEVKHTLFSPTHAQESGVAWDDALETQLCYEIKTFLLAGHETSAAMLTWSCFECILSKNVMQQVRL
jgi:cytochrome P450